MEATIALVLLLTFLVGGMMLALVTGYRSIEAERTQQDAQLRAASAQLAQVIVGTGFFESGPHAGRPTPPVVFDDALVARLEQHVRAEQDSVTQFVHFPSVDSLYSKPGSSLRVH
jgi:hypothetical protein